MHEGNIRPALPEVGNRAAEAHRSLVVSLLTAFFSLPSAQSVRLYFLGKETMEQEEEDSLATRHTCWRPRWHCPHRRHSHTCHDYWHSCVCGKEGEDLGPVAGTVLRPLLLLTALSSLQFSLLLIELHNQTEAQLSAVCTHTHTCTHALC